MAEIRLVTGNRLRDGVPVYFAGAGEWSRDIAAARWVESEEGDALLAEATASPRPHPVVAPYLIDARIAEGRVRPVTLREQIRAFGPTTVGGG